MACLVSLKRDAEELHQTNQDQLILTSQHRQWSANIKSLINIQNICNPSFYQSINLSVHNFCLIEYIKTSQFGAM